MVRIAFMIGCKIRSDLGQARGRDCVLIVVVCRYASIAFFIDAKILAVFIYHNFMMCHRRIR